MNSRANQGGWFTTGPPSLSSEGCVCEQPGRHEGLGIECRSGGRIPVCIPPKGVRNYLPTGLLSPFRLCVCPGLTRGRAEPEGCFETGRRSGLQ